MRPHRWQPTRLPCPWDSPSKNTRVGCHFLLQCMKVKSESEIAQLCPTPVSSCDPLDCSLPGSPVHGIFQARVLEWGAIAFSVSFFSFIQFYCPSRVQLTSNCLRKSSLTALAHMLFSLLWSTAACNESQFKGKSYFWITSCVLVLMLYSFPSEAGYIKDSNARSLINFHCYHLASI